MRIRVAGGGQTLRGLSSGRCGPQPGGWLAARSGSSDPTQPSDSDATQPDDSDESRPGDSDVNRPGDSDVTRPDEAGPTIGQLTALRLRFLRFNVGASRTSPPHSPSRKTKANERRNEESMILETSATLVKCAVTG